MFIKRYCVETHATVDEGQALQDMVRNREHFEIEANFPEDLQVCISFCDTLAVSACAWETCR